MSGRFINGIVFGAVAVFAYNYFSNGSTDEYAKFYMESKANSENSYFSDLPVILEKNGLAGMEQVVIIHGFVDNMDFCMRHKKFEEESNGGSYSCNSIK